MEIIREVSRWGNGAGVLLPKEWAGNQVKVVFIDRTLEIKGEALSILEPHLDNILGIYLTGSYARGEQEQDSDIDIIAISEDTAKDIISGKYNISIIPKESVKKTLEKNPILILPRLNEAKTILNSSLLEELKDIKIKKSCFKEFIKECRRIIRINRGLINLDKENAAKYLDSAEIVYSLILRLRGVFLIKTILTKSRYHKKEFLRLLSKNIDKHESEKVYNIYKSVRDDKKTDKKIKIETAKKLLEILEKEVKSLEK